MSSVALESSGAVREARSPWAPARGRWVAPGYYSVLFEDPEGIRIEVNFVPGKGRFGSEGRLGPGGEGPAGELTEGGLK